MLRQPRVRFGRMVPQDLSPGLWLEEWLAGRRSGKGAVCASSQLQHLGTSMSDSLHYCEAGPLHSNLRYAEQTCKASEAINILAACKVCSTCWEHKYVGKSACSRRRPKEHEIWRQAERRTAVDDADVLREVGYQNADEDEATKMQSETASRNSSYCNILQRDSEIDAVWRGQVLAMRLHSFRLDSSSTWPNQP